MYPGSPQCVFGSCREEFVHGDLGRTKPSMRSFLQGQVGRPRKLAWLIKIRWILGSCPFGDPNCDSPFWTILGTYYVEPLSPFALNLIQDPKVVRTLGDLYVFTSTCASRHNGVHFFDLSTSKSGPNVG